MDRVRWRALSSGPAVAALLLVLAATPVSATQTFPDPFGGEGTFTDLRAGSTGQDIGDVFFLREGPVLRVRIFLTAPRTFIESHVCVSAQMFTERVPPGQCQYAETGTASDTYDVTLPPDDFPTGTTAFTDPLGPICAQVHVAYDAPGLALTRSGGGSAYGGWEPGQPFFGNICLPAVPDPEPPDEATVELEKTGALIGGDVTFTITVTNPTATTAASVTVIELLPPSLTWTLPPGCATVVGGLVHCDVGDIAGGDSVELVFTATPGPTDCGTFSNAADAMIGAKVRSSSADSAVVEVPCPPQPDEPLILITKTAMSTAVQVPGTITYEVLVENVGPGDAIDVEFTDELPSGPTWSIGSGSRVCSISGTTLSCAAPVVPDGVFEVIEIFGTVDGSFCGVIDNSASIAWEGGTARGLSIADAAQVEITGCSAVLPSSVENPTPSPNPTTDGGAGAGGGGGVPDTRLPEPMAPLGPIAAVVATVLALGLVTYLRVAHRLRR